MSHIYAQSVPLAPSSGTHSRGRSRSRNSPPRAMPSPQFPVSTAPYYQQYQSSDPGHGYAPTHARHASYSGQPTYNAYQQMPGAAAGQTYYVARSPSRHHRRSESAGHRHHRSHSTTHHRSSSTTAAPRHSSHRHSSTTRHHSSVPHRSQSAVAARRHTYNAPQRRYSTHHASNLSFGDRIRKLLHIGRFGNHGKPYYVDSRGRELDRSGRPIVAY